MTTSTITGQLLNSKNHPIGYNILSSEELWQ